MKEEDTKLVTVFEVRYRGELIFSKQFSGILNDTDLVTESDLRNLPVCKNCKKEAVWYLRPQDEMCKRCWDNECAADAAAVQQMFDIGYW